MRRQPPRRACSIYAALPHPAPIHWHFKFHSMSSFVKHIHPLSPFNQSMSFSCMSYHIGGYLDRNGPQQKGWDCLGKIDQIVQIFLHLTLMVFVKISIRFPKMPLHSMFFLKLRISDTLGLSWEVAYMLTGEHGNSSSSAMFLCIFFTHHGRMHNSLLIGIHNYMYVGVCQKKKGEKKDLISKLQGNMFN